MNVIERDVIIAGAGPAGAVCASYLAKAGMDVLLIDRNFFPRDKVCGDMVSERFVSHMDELECVEELDRISTCIRRIRLIGDGRNEAVVPFECYTTERKKLDKLLIDTAGKWGAEIWQGCRVKDVMEENGYVKGVKVVFHGREMKVRSKVVVGADGAYSQVAKATGAAKSDIHAVSSGLRAYFKNIKLDRNLGTEQYNTYGIVAYDDVIKQCCFRLVPVGRRGAAEGICNVSVVTRGLDVCSEADMIHIFALWMKKNPSVARMFEGAVQISPWKSGRLPYISQGRKQCGDGYVLVGDAASVMMPLYDDGLSAAADSARAAARAIIRAAGIGDFQEAVLKEGYELAVKAEGVSGMPLRNDELKAHIW